MSDRHAPESVIGMGWNTQDETSGETGLNSVA
jgi:hypothetical protein